MSLAVFAVKNGGGLAYLSQKMPDTRKKTGVALAFIGGYGFVFLSAAFLLANVNLAVHLDSLQTFFKSGMTLHFLLALLMGLWGVKLLTIESAQTSRGWIPLVMPCPVCFTAILLSCSFVKTLYPDNNGLLFGLYLGFILVSLVSFGSMARLIKTSQSADRFLGTLLLYIAGYFMLSVIVIPQFADMERIFRISRPEPISKIEPAQWLVMGISLAALVAGLIKPLRKE